MVIQGLEDEVWKPVLDYEGFYEASSLGRIKSLGKVLTVNSGRTGGHKKVQSACLMKPFLNKKGYLTVVLSKLGIKKTKPVHRLVLEAFTGKDTRQVNHIDGIKINNKVLNLEWVTAKENSLHATRVLGKKRGKDAPKAKLTEVDVRMIVMLLNAGYSQREIAKVFSVTNGAIYRIQHGFNWSWLTGYDRKGGEQCL